MLQLAACCQKAPSIFDGGNVQFFGSLDAHVENV